MPGTRALCALAVRKKVPPPQRQPCSGRRRACGLRVRAGRPRGGRCLPAGPIPLFPAAPPSAAGDVGPALVSHLGACAASALGAAAVPRASTVPPPVAAALPETGLGHAQHAGGGAHGGAPCAVAAGAAGLAAGGQAAAPAAPGVPPRISPSPVRPRGSGSSAAAGAAVADIPRRGLARSLVPAPRGSRRQAPPSAAFGAGVPVSPLGADQEPAAGLASVVGRAPAGPPTASPDDESVCKVRLALRGQVAALGPVRVNGQGTAALRLSGASLRLVELLDVADALETVQQLVLFNVHGPSADRWILNVARSLGLSEAAVAHVVR
ncbi:unnamed protein product [Prorocentrum cordatum]|uniref:Uncharacterized protein n=1 Tax=Prorocentrum cordatum TaxID=2364126 RepID=A0ABN9V5I0_9DINO|nr:unnamed protein product [Polarella glacialis]